MYVCRDANLLLPCFVFAQRPEVFRATEQAAGGVARYLRSPSMGRQRKVAALAIHSHADPGLRYLCFEVGAIFRWHTCQCLSLVLRSQSQEQALDLSARSGAGTCSGQALTVAEYLRSTVTSST